MDGCEGRVVGSEEVMDGGRKPGHMTTLVCGLTLERTVLHAVCLHDVLEVLDKNAQSLCSLFTAFVRLVILVRNRRRA